MKAMMSQRLRAILSHPDSAHALQKQLTASDRYFSKAEQHAHPCFRKLCASQSAPSKKGRGLGF